MTSGRFLAIIVVSIALLVTPSFALEPRNTKWADLAPEPVEYENPFSKLTRAQLAGLRKLLRHRQGEKLPEQELSALRLKLMNEGLDVDWLFKQREIIMKQRREASTKTTDSIVGHVVRIPGYLLPLEFKDRKAVEFLLVPNVGACIHTPPPPPNQMVHVYYPAGFRVTGLYSPILITGRLEAEWRTPNVGFVDGRKQVEVSYVMKADAVEPFSQEGRREARPFSILEARKRPTP